MDAQVIIQFRMERHAQLISVANGGYAIVHGSKHLDIFRYRFDKRGADERHGDIGGFAIRYAGSPAQGATVRKLPS